MQRGMESKSYNNALGLKMEECHAYSMVRTSVLLEFVLRLRKWLLTLWVVTNCCILASYIPEGLDKTKTPLFYCIPVFVVGVLHCAAFSFIHLSISFWFLLLFSVLNLAVTCLVVFLWSSSAWNLIDVDGAFIVGLLVCLVLEASLASNVLYKSVRSRFSWVLFSRVVYISHRDEFSIQIYQGR